MSGFLKIACDIVLVLLCLSPPVMLVDVAFCVFSVELP